MKITANTPFRFNLSELFRYRELVYYFAWRDIKVKYRQAYLGVLWALIQPAILMVIFYFVFYKSLKVSVGVNYPVYVFGALILWGLFSSGISNSCDNMLNQAQMMKKIYFPRLIIPVASFAISLFDFLIALILLLILIIFFKQPISIDALYCFPAAVLLVFISSFGLGTLLSALCIKYRDFRYVLPFFLQMLFFSSQVVYSIRMLNETWMRNLLYCNPLNGALELWYYPMHNESLELRGVMISFITAFFLLFVGVYYFKKTEMYFADIL